MHPRLLRASVALATTAAIIGGSLLAAPAANASTHKIDSDSKYITQVVKVGSHKDKLYLDAATKKSTAVRIIDGEKAQYVAAKYKLTLKNSHKKVIYRTTVTSWRAINTSATVMMHKYKSDASLVKAIKVLVKKSEATSKKEARAIYIQIAAELAASFFAYGGLGTVSKWISEQPTQPTTFDGFTIPQPGNGVVLTVSGTPAAFAVKATITKYNSSVTVTSAGDVKWSSNSAVSHTN